MIGNTIFVIARFQGEKKPPPPPPPASFQKLLSSLIGHLFLLRVPVKARVAAIPVTIMWDNTPFKT